MRSDDDASDQEIADLLDRLGKELYSDRKKLNDTLSHDFADVPTVLVLATARALFPARQHLSNWPNYVKRARVLFVARGLDADELLQGLEDEDEPNRVS